MRKEVSRNFDPSHFKCFSTGEGSEAQELGVSVSTYTGVWDVPVCWNVQLRVFPVKGYVEIDTGKHTSLT